jgi:putative transposase
MLTTYHYRVKDAGKAHKILSEMSKSVNVVWNFCKQTQSDALRIRPFRTIKDKKTACQVFIPNFLSSAEMDGLVAGTSQELGLHSQTVQAVSQEYVRRRIQFKKLLRWRGRKSLAWIPFKSSGIQFHGSRVKYAKHEFKIWNSYKIPKGNKNNQKYKDYDARGFPCDSVIKTGSFSQDKRGRWYLNITFESQKIGIERENDKEIGIDIGIKTLATCSDGEKIERPNLRKAFLTQIRRLKKCQKYAQRMQSKRKIFKSLPKLKQERNLFAKISNNRRDYLHKESLKIVKKSSLIVVGNVPCKLMNRSKNLSGISYDSGIGLFKEMLKYKAVRAASIYTEFSERNSTRTCSQCSFALPRIGLGVRSWICEKCDSVHDRDTNAAINILQAYQAKFRMGHHTPIHAQNNTA